MMIRYGSTLSSSDLDIVLLRAKVPFVLLKVEAVTLENFCITRKDPDADVGALVGV